MTVYVDKSKNHFRGMVMCHMLADTEDELHAFAARLGLLRKWFQPLSSPHYDISLSKRKIAVELGAVEVDRQQLVKILKLKREAAKIKQVEGMSYEEGKELDQLYGLDGW